jgi:hypothetical protein
MLFGGDEEQHAVVLGGGPELPKAEQIVGVGLDLLSVQRGDGGDDELDRRFLFEMGELGFKVRFGDRRQHVRVVDHTARQRRKAVSRPNGADPQQRQQGREKPGQNFTLGAASASGAAVNSAIGLLPE